MRFCGVGKQWTSRLSCNRLWATSCTGRGPLHHEPLIDIRHTSSLCAISTSSFLQLILNSTTLLSGKMAESRVPRKAEHSLHIVEDERLVISELRDEDQQELVDVVSELDDSASICPKTPPRPGHLVHIYDEISPTNTSFSDDTIFDLSHLPDETSIEDPFCDDIPDVAP